MGTTCGSPCGEATADRPLWVSCWMERTARCRPLCAARGQRGLGPSGWSCPSPPRSSFRFQGDQGGLRTLQKKWTSFLKARLICSRPDSNLVFNVLQDVFVLRAEGLKEPVIYGVFTPQL